MRKLSLGQNRSPNFENFTLCCSADDFALVCVFELYSIDNMVDCSKESDGALLIFRVALQDMYTLRNAIYRSMSVLQNGYGGSYIGISNDAERVPPCESEPLLNFGMGMFYFTHAADAKRFVYCDQPFMESEFLDHAAVFIVPVVRPIFLGPITIRLVNLLLKCCHRSPPADSTAFLITETQKLENYCQLPDKSNMCSITACGAVPYVADTTQVVTVRSCGQDVKGIRISQFPDKKIFYDWVQSDCGARFREEMCKVRSLNSYIATFSRDIF
ncbi:hypothetical protein FGIG_04459 [Fasciola gigantica]|uniref:Uncharacterized protein n=1 Tax=Fasciola gigantica TaxID=46835 RepID=A0A504Y998_FASGI|nr:hypothetical protein FGIG_04459 [Fasciola gigantica]